jgi:hypothetical protein
MHTSEEAGGSNSLTGDGGAEPTEEDGAEPNIQQESTLAVEEPTVEDGAEPKIQQASMAVDPGRDSLPTDQGGAAASVCTSVLLENEEVKLRGLAKAAKEVLRLRELEEENVRDDAQKAEEDKIIAEQTHQEKEENPPPPVRTSLRVPKSAVRCDVLGTKCPKTPTFARPGVKHPSRCFAHKEPEMHKIKVKSPKKPTTKKRTADTSASTTPTLEPPLLQPRTLILVEKSKYQGNQLERSRNKHPPIQRLLAKLEICKTCLPWMKNPVRLQSLKKNSNAKLKNVLLRQPMLSRRMLTTLRLFVTSMLKI